MQRQAGKPDQLFKIHHYLQLDAMSRVLLRLLIAAARARLKLIRINLAEIICRNVLVKYKYAFYN